MTTQNFMTLKHAVFIDPSYREFQNDQLFNCANSVLNRDNQLLPFARLKESLELRNIPVHTADSLRDGKIRADVMHYWSLGIIDYRSLCSRTDVRLRGFVIMEPPLVASHIYKELPQLSKDFEHVYLHNTIGDGYSLRGVDRSRLVKFFVPQPYCDVIETAWHNEDRQNKLVVIAGLHNPGSHKPELYSKRIEAIGRLYPMHAIDLYGRGWDRWWTHQAASLAFWRYRVAIRQSYRGPVVSKINTLSQYRFSLCFENMPMYGYVTEKIFDCFYSGTVPVYLGAQNISDLIPPDTYIDMRNFGSDNYEAMWHTISKMSICEWRRLRSAGREFVRGVSARQYHDGLLNMIGEGLE